MKYIIPDQYAFVYVIVSDVPPILIGKASSKILEESTDGTLWSSFERGMYNERLKNKELSFDLIYHDDDGLELHIMMQPEEYLNAEFIVL